MYGNTEERIFVLRSTTAMKEKKPASNPVPTRIDVLNDEDIKLWTHLFSVSERELRNAVFIAGSSAEKVKDYLSKRTK